MRQSGDRQEAIGAGRELHRRGDVRVRLPQLRGVRPCAVPLLLGAPPAIRWQSIRHHEVINRASGGHREGIRRPSGAQRVIRRSSGNGARVVRLHKAERCNQAPSSAIKRIQAIERNQRWRTGCAAARGGRRRPSRAGGSRRRGPRPDRRAAPPPLGPAGRQRLRWRR